MATPVTLAIGSADGQVVVSAAGELDMSNVETFSKALADAVSQSDGRPVRLDLRDVEYLDSGAINVLFGYTEQVRLVVNPMLVAALRVSGLTEVASVQTEPE
jgi:anti-anti-sigma factor